MYWARYHFFSLACIIMTVSESERKKKGIESFKSYLHYGSLTQVKSKLKKWNQVATYIFCFVFLFGFLFMQKQTVKNVYTQRKLKDQLFNALSLYTLVIKCEAVCGLWKILSFVFLVWPSGVISAVSFIEETLPQKIFTWEWICLSGFSFFSPIYILLGQ